MSVILSKHIKGFTLLELLVVISIIGILAIVVLASLSTARQQAHITVAIKSFTEIEKALVAYRIDHPEPWPVSQTVPDFQQNSIKNMIDNGGKNGMFSGFSAYLPSEPNNPTQESIYSYHYSSGNDYFCDMNSSPSPHAHNSGVSIRLGDVTSPYELDDFTEELFDVMDQKFDQGDGPACGRVRKGGSSESVYYLISENPGDLTL